MPWRVFGETLVTFVVIFDPIGSVPFFLALTEGRAPRERHRAAYLAVLAAAGVLAAFAAFGQALLAYLSISLESLMVAGGLLLLLVAAEMLRGGDPTAGVPEDASLALVPLGTPWLAGPGAIVQTVLAMRRHEELPERLAVVGGIALALGLVLLALRLATLVARVIRPSAIHFVTRIMGLLLTAIAVQLIVDAVARWLRGGLA